MPPALPGTPARRRRPAVRYNDYHLALIKARRTQHRLSLDTAERISGSLDKWVTEVMAQYRRALRGTRRTDHWKRIQLPEELRQLAKVQAAFDAAVEKAVELGVVTTSRDIYEIWHAASESVAALGNVGPPTWQGFDALRGGIRTAGVMQTAWFESGTAQGLGSQTWRTALKGHLTDAGSEMNRIVSSALMENLHPEYLEKRLRPYVIGTDSPAAFYGADGKLNRALSGIPPKLRGPVGRVESNARRIAFTEITNARGAAEVRAWLSDPYVQAVKWQRSPVRGRLTSTCSCDILAETDFYGLGKGVYPVTRVPSASHPFCRCERVPVAVDEPLGPGERPNPPLSVNPQTVRIPARPEGEMHSAGPVRPVTKARARAIREQTARSLGIAEASRPDPMASLPPITPNF